MKLAYALLLAAMVGSTNAFQATPLCSHRQSTTSLYGLFDFKVFHGSGSAEKKDGDLDDQWALQQEILRERRGQGTKDQLKSKYSGKGDVQFIGAPSAKKIKARAAEEKKEDTRYFWEK
jgi:hypothetical protein